METIAVYKTDVKDPTAAESILDEIREQFHNCDVSFDLDDCGKILRVAYPSSETIEPKVKAIIEKFGVQAEKLICVTC